MYERLCTKARLSLGGVGNETRCSWYYIGDRDKEWGNEFLNERRLSHRPDTDTGQALPIGKTFLHMNSVHIFCECENCSSWCKRICSLSSTSGVIRGAGEAAHHSGTLHQQDGQDVPVLQVDRGTRSELTHVLTDMLLRQGQSTPQTVSKPVEVLGNPNINLLATTFNHQLLVFVWPASDPSTNLLSCCTSIVVGRSANAYVFPPSGLLPWVLWKAQVDTDSVCIWSHLIGTVVFGSQTQIHRRHYLQTASWDIWVWSVKHDAGTSSVKGNVWLIYKLD